MGMVEIFLQGLAGSGRVVLVDDSDYPLVSKYKWYCKHGYACTATHRTGTSKGDKSRTINLVMHRLIMGAKKGQQVDHINGNRLDNRKCNLRIATHIQNCWNKKKMESRVGFTGVRQESTNVFSARVGHRVIGYYDTAVKAAHARDIEALRLRGEFARTNFSKEDLPAYVEPLPLRNIGVRTSNVVGVSYAKNRRAKHKWRVVKNKKHLGWFNTEADAIQFLQGVVT